MRKENLFKQSVKEIRYWRHYF